MIGAALVGALAQASLILSGLAVYVVRVPRRLVGILAGYGAGALIGAIAFDLIPESEVLPTVETAAWLLVGAAVFVVADRFVESRFGEGVRPARSGSSSGRWWTACRSHSSSGSSSPPGRA